jgi:hypothetical protein
MESMNVFKNAFNKIKGIVTGGSDSSTENISKKDQIKSSKNGMGQKEINHLHNYNAMMNKRKAIRRMRRKMRRETQQNQR